MDNGRYFALKLKPGKHIVHMTDDKKGYAVDMGPGQTYYFRIGIEMGMMKGHGKITLDDADRAVTEIKKIKFIGQDKIKAFANRGSHFAESAGASGKFDAQGQAITIAG